MQIQIIETKHKCKINKQSETKHKITYKPKYKLAKSKQNNLQISAKSQAKTKKNNIQNPNHLTNYCLHLQHYYCC